MEKVRKMPKYKLFYVCPTQEEIQCPVGLAIRIIS